MVGHVCKKGLPVMSYAFLPRKTTPSYAFLNPDPQWTRFLPHKTTPSYAFINPGSPMDPLPCNIWPGRWRSDSARLDRPRYTMTDRDHDPVPDQHLQLGDLVRASTGRPGCGGTAVRLRPRSSDRGYAGSLLASLSRPTRSGLTGNDWPGRLLGVGLGSRRSG